jgi:hypothetical protein
VDGRQISGREDLIAYGSLKFCEESQFTRSMAILKSVYRSSFEVLCGALSCLITLVSGVSQNWFSSINSSTSECKGYFAFTVIFIVS